MKVLALAVLCGGFVAAHDSYLMPAKFTIAPGEPVLISVHNGDSFPASEHPTDPARVAEIRLSDGTPVMDLQMAGRATHGFVTTSQNGSLYVAARLQTRPLVMEAAKFEAYLREEGLLHVLEARNKAGKGSAPGRELYTKYAKAYIVSGTPDDGFSVPVGHAIEFVPDSDPSMLSAGSPLAMRILFRGEPLAGVQVAKASWSGGKVGHEIVGCTGSDGRIIVPINSAGRYRLHAVHMEASANSAKADWESFWASFTFEVSSPAVRTSLITPQ